MAVPITEVVKGIFRIGPLETGHPSAATAPFLVVGNRQAAVVEPGEDGQVSGLLQAMSDLDVDLDSVAYIVPTHIHLHHIQGVPLLLTKLPNAKLAIHPRAAPHVVEPARLIASTIEAWGDKCYGLFSPIPQEKVLAVEDGQVFDLGERELQVIYAPGHAPHHINIFDRTTRALWSGDAVAIGPGRERARQEIRPPLFDVEQHVQTLRRLRHLNPFVLLTFSSTGGGFSPDKTLRLAEEDILAIEQICREGMKQKSDYKEIVQKVEKYESSFGSQPTAGSEFMSGGLFGLIAYLKRRDASLQMPTGISPRMRS